MKTKTCFRTMNSFLNRFWGLLLQIKNLHKHCPQIQQASLGALKTNVILKSKLYYKIKIKFLCFTSFSDKKNPSRSLEVGSWSQIYTWLKPVEARNPILRLISIFKLNEAQSSKELSIYFCKQFSICIHSNSCNFDVL